MRYVLNNRYRFRGWYKLPACVLDTEAMDIMTYPIKEYTLLLRCDGAHDLNREELTQPEQETLDRFLKENLIHEAEKGELLQDHQFYKTYPARYRKEVHWSVIGACNLKCRHCFMSAPQAKHGNPCHEDIIRIADQLAECGIFNVGITGGEPLIRKDFFEIVDALKEREIRVSVIYTNGWLLDEAFLAELEKRRIHPSFQLSYDGKGWHDFLRGIEGCEERTDRALSLLQKGGYSVSAAMCLHRKNAGSIRETVRHLSDYGVSYLKVGTIMELGEWADPKLRNLSLTEDEALQITADYIPQYFEDNAPMDIMLCGSFLYSKRKENWSFYGVREIDGEREKTAMACPSLKNSFYLGADGVVSPCMGMADTEFAENFPSLRDMTLSEILKDSDYVRYSGATVKEVRDGNPLCRNCDYVNRCAGGCRNEALVHGEDFYAVDPLVCAFHRHGWEEKMRRIIEPAYEAYLAVKKPQDPSTSLEKQ
ncbi:MAG: radical SAM protein [Solobacterium sp.]|nr:radical SAM protein [Solobacterium sp.]